MEGNSSDGEVDRVTIPEDEFLKARWQEIAERKNESYAIRSQIKRAKSRVEQARQERDFADNDFMSALRPTQAGLTSSSATPSMASLQARFQRMQTARDACQQFEISLVHLQDSLGEAEDELDLLERRFINNLRLITRGGTVREKSKIQVPEQRQSDLLKGLEIEPANICNPLYQRLLFALRSFDLARRCRVDVLAHKARLEGKKRQMLIFEKHHPAALRYVAPLEISDYEFLKHFEMQERRVSDEMAAWRSEVERLTRLCWGRNLISQYIPLEHVLSWYPGEFSIDFDLEHNQMEAASTEPTEFSILLSNPSNLLEDFPVTAEASLKRATSIPEGHPQRVTTIASAAKELTIQNLLSDAEDMPNFINRWLLQSLRTSRLQVGALYSSYLTSGHSGIFDIETWQQEILHKWWEDEEHMRSLEHFRPAQTSWTSAPPSPPSWLSEAVLYTWDSDFSEPKFEMTELEQCKEICEADSQE
ncbi:hypothetical protein N0V82_007877 [Gnomoniopsis sp. IMI 355080]|nr:hypothetical protein N0V82_007877 [Gnomoniopsis sp. IMI 355080]